MSFRVIYMFTKRGFGTIESPEFFKIRDLIFDNGVKSGSQLYDKGLLGYVFALVGFGINLTSPKTKNKP